MSQFITLPSTTFVRRQPTEVLLFPLYRRRSCLRECTVSTFTSTLLSFIRTCRDLRFLFSSVSPSVWYLIHSNPYVSSVTLLITFEFLVKHTSPHPRAVSSLSWGIPRHKARCDRNRIGLWGRTLFQNSKLFTGKFYWIRIKGRESVKEGSETMLSANFFLVPSFPPPLRMLTFVNDNRICTS